MYLPRPLLSHLYTSLQRSRHSYSSPVLLLVALDPDALCACRILIKLFKRDSILYNITPVAGYGDLARAAEKHVQPLRRQNGGAGGTVVCLGVGGLVDLGEVFGLETETGIKEQDDDPTGGLEFWVLDARRPWNLGNVFGGRPPEALEEEEEGDARRGKLGVVFGEINQDYKPGKGGVIVFDDGDISEELEKEREAYFKLELMPEIEDDGKESDFSESESEGESPDSSESRKRKRGLDEEDEGDEELGRPRQRRRSESQDSLSSLHVRPDRRGLISTSSIVPDTQLSQSPSPSAPPPSHQPKPASARRIRRRLLRLKRKHEATLQAYYSLGISYSEPISSLLYSLASELGREDNEALWDAIVGVSSMELYGRIISRPKPSPSEMNTHIGWVGDRGERIQQVLRDEVRRLNQPDPRDLRGEDARGGPSGVIPTTASSPTDYSIRLSPEPRFLLIRHWSLYDSMLHSPYLAARLNLWTDIGRKRLDKLLAKMGMKLDEVKQNYTHMDMSLKRLLRQKLLKNAPIYSLEGLVPPEPVNGRSREGWGFVRSWGWKACLSAMDVAVIIGAILEVGKGEVQKLNDNETSSQAQDLTDSMDKAEGEEYVRRFYEAYDALENVTALTHALPRTMHLHRAILRTGSALLSKKHIMHLRAYRMGIVRDGPDVQLFTHPGALTKLTLWVGGAIMEQEKDHGRKATPLVLACANEMRGVYIVVGTGVRGFGFGVREKEIEARKREREKRKKEREAAKEKKRAERKVARATKRAARGQSNDADDEEEDEEEDETESEGSEEDDDEKEGFRDLEQNRFGNSFLEVVEETNARVRMESFDHYVVEVKKDDLAIFLESLSSKSVGS